MQELPTESIERLSRVAKLVGTQRTLPAKLETIVALAKRTIPNCHAAGVSLIIQGEPTTTAVTDRLAVEIDLVQYETGQGPCLAAIDESEIIRIDVLERDSRFSRFAPGALALDINSVLSMPLAANGQVVGALNLYSRLTDAFDDDDDDDDQTVRAAQPLADAAAEAISRSPLYAYTLDMVEGLVETLESQALVAQATGVLMVTDGCTAGEALDMVRDLALATGVSLRTVAERVVAEHSTDPLSADQARGLRGEGS